MKKILLITMILLSIMSLIVFSQTEYTDTPENAELDIYDLNLYDGYQEYSNRNMNLPRYIPQYLGQELYLKGYSKYSKKIVGRYVPRYWDGEKYSNFRTDGYDPRNLTSDEIQMLDQITLNMYSNKDTANKCSYVIEFKTTKDVNPTSVNDYKNLINIPYYYDMGYWYVPEIRDAFDDDCNRLYDQNTNDLTPVVTFDGSTYYYFDVNEGELRKDIFVNKLCGKQTSLYLSTLQRINYEVLKTYYNSSSYIEVITELYNDVTSVKNTDGTCTLNSAITFDCISESQLIKDLKIKDDWMLKVISGNYIPYDVNYLSYTSPQEITNYFYSTDIIYRNCVNNFNSETNLWDTIKYLFNSEYKTQWDYCQNYIQDSVRVKIGIADDWTSKGVQSVIWKHYANTYLIQEGSNLYPYNIKFSGIRCRENDTYFNSGVFNPLNPFAETPYVTCNYTTSDPEIVKVGYYFDVRINPVSAFVMGADSVSESYNTEYFRHVFRNYDINISQINILNFTGGFTIVSWVDLNRSKENGCTFLFVTNESVSKFVESVDTGNQGLQKEAERLPSEVIRQIEVQLRLVKAEIEKAQFFFYIDIVAKLIFRMFILLYYCLSVVFLLYIIKVVMGIPNKMLEIIRNLGTSKHNRKRNSMLNED